MSYDKRLDCYHCKLVDYDVEENTYRCSGMIDGETGEPKVLHKHDLVNNSPDWCPLKN